MTVFLHTAKNKQQCPLCRGGLCLTALCSALLKPIRQYKRGKGQVFCKQFVPIRTPNHRVTTAVIYRRKVNMKALKQDVRLVDKKETIWLSWLIENKHFLIAHSTYEEMVLQLATTSVCTHNAWYLEETMVTGWGPSSLLHSQTFPLWRSAGPTSPMRIKILFSSQPAASAAGNNTRNTCCNGLYSGWILIMWSASFVWQDKSLTDRTKHLGFAMSNPHVHCSHLHFTNILSLWWSMIDHESYDLWSYDLLKVSTVSSNLVLTCSIL